MKGLILGMIAGAAAMYVCTKKMKQEDYDKWCDKASDLWEKGKEKVKDTIDMGKNKAEYMGDRAEDYLDKANTNS
ncbi:MAG: hypothetical protein LUE93_02385 [Bacteroides sp.]|nr:hypothetical protein [Bacteroides sp.]